MSLPPQAGPCQPRVSFIFPISLLLTPIIISHTTHSSHGSLPFSVDPAQTPLSALNITNPKFCNPNFSYAMAIVTGDRYLESLVKFVEYQAERLIEGSLVLKLNPVGLRYVQSRLEALGELESLLAGAPVDYLRAYVSDLGDHRALEQLRRILRLLPSLKVVSLLPPPRRDPTPLFLLPFGSLKVLELRGCDLSTSSAKGLLELRFTLEKLICHNSTVSADFSYRGFLILMCLQRWSPWVLVWISKNLLLMGCRSYGNGKFLSFVCHVWLSISRLEKTPLGVLTLCILHWVYWILMDAWRIFGRFIVLTLSAIEVLVHHSALETSQVLISSACCNVQSIVLLTFWLLSMDIFLGCIAACICE